MKNLDLMKSEVSTVMAIICMGLIFAPLYGAGFQVPEGIEFHNTGPYIKKEFTNIDAGPGVGGILNAHYFPGIVFYIHGRYSDAWAEFVYFLERPQYTEMNPRQAEFFTTAHYLRGAIFLYHASGPGRHILAQQDFEASIKWNPANYLPYLGLSDLYAELDYKEKAVAILQQFINANPNSQSVPDAKQAMEKLRSTVKK